MKNRKTLFKKKKEKEATYHEIDIDLTEERKFNITHTQQFTVLNLLPKTFLEFIQSPPHLWFIFLLCLSFTPYVHPISFKISISISLFSLFLFRLFKNFLLGKLQSDHDRKLNEAQVAIFTGVDFIMMRSEDVREGDLVLLKTNDQCPADSLILAVDNENNEVYVDIRKVNGETDYIRKRTLKETQNYVVYDGMSIADLKKHLEFVKIVIPNERFQDVQGKIKIKGSPRVLVTGYENFLMKGSYIVDCGWVLALVAYVGTDCKTQFNSTEPQQKQSKFHDYLIYSLVGSSILLLIYVIFTVFLGIFHKGLMFSDSNLSLVFNSIIIFGNLVPITLDLALDLYSFAKLQILNTKNSNFRINNEKILKDLGLVEYVLTEKSNVLTQGETKVRACLVNQSLFVEHLEDPLFNRRDSDLLESPESSDKSVLKTPQFKLDVLKDDLASPDCSKEKWLLAVSLLICNSFMPNDLNECISSDEESLKKFSIRLGLKLISRSGQIFEIEFRSKRFIYSVISYSEPARHCWFKALVKDNSTGEAILIHRGPLERISPYLQDEEESGNLEEFSSQFLFKCLKKIVIGFKVLTTEEVKLFMLDYKQIQSVAVNKRQRIVDVFDNHSANLKLLGLLGIEQDVPGKNKEAVQDMIDAGVKIWITTRENEESALASGYSFGIIDEDMVAIRLSDFKSQHEALLEVRNILKNEIFSRVGMNEETCRKSVNRDSISGAKIQSVGLVRRRSSLHPMLLSLGYGMGGVKDLNKVNADLIKMFLTIDGKTLDLASRSRELLKNLMVILFTAKAVFAYDLCPEQKRLLVKIVKENFQYKPVVLAVGEKYGNRKMIIEASIGVQLSENFKRNTHLVDMFVTSFAVLPKVILKNGVDCYNGYRVLIFLSTYKQILVITAFFLYQSLCGFSGCYLVSPDLYVLYEFCISLVFIVLVSLFSTVPLNWRDYQRYQLNAISSGKSAIQILTMILYSISQGVLLFFFVVYGVASVVNEDGFTEDFETLGVVFLILFVAFLYIQGLVILFAKVNSLPSACTSFITFVIILSVTTNINFDSSYLSHSSFTKRSTIWFVICVLPFATLLFSAVFFEYFKNLVPKTTSRLAQFRSRIAEIYCDSSSLKFSKEEDDFELDKLTLEFKQPYREIMYRTSVVKSSAGLLRVFFLLVSLVSVIDTILVTTGEAGFFNIGIYSVVISVYQIVLVVVSFVSTKHLVSLNLFSLLSILVYCLTESYLNSLSFTAGRYPLLIILFCLFLHSNWKYTIFNCFLIYSVSIATVIYEIFKTNNKAEPVLSVIWIIIMFFISELTLIYSYNQARNRKFEYILIQKTEIEFEKSASILNYLLPEFVRKRVKDGVRYIAEDKGTVSVIFCDICEFDKIVNLYSPQELTLLIDNIFGRIDLICETFGITKVETVGKTYLACTGLKDSELAFDQNILKISHARRAVEMALEVIRESKKIMLKDGSHLMFKIGINSGPVTAGVVGFHKPQFSLVGDTVNTASRMASTLKEANSIQISFGTFDLLEDTRGLTFKDCRIDVKGKGFMDTKVVEMPVHLIEEIVTEEVNSMFNKRRSSVLMLHSTPTLLMSGGRSVDTPHLSGQSRGARSSLMFNLDIRTPSELIEKKKSRRLFKFFYYLFRETDEEKEFRKNSSESIQEMQKLGLVSSAVSCGVLIVVEFVFVIVGCELSSVFRLVILVIFEVFSIILILLKKNQTQLKFCYFNSLLYSAAFVLFFIENNTMNRSLFIEFAYFSYLFILLNFYSGTVFKRNLPFSLPLVAFWLSEVFRFSLNFYSVVEVLFFILAVQTVVFLNEKKLRINAVLKSAAEKELEKTQQLLTQMMPPHALAKLEEGQEVSDRLSKVTLMYADIVGFTAWSSIRTPREVVGMLSELFTRFDKMCIENNVYKVHTIGDCYVAMGYVDNKNRNPAKEAVNMINFATSLINLIQETNEKCKIQLGMRIGVHTGDIIGGITGTKIVRYDIYGSDVLIANKMESNGEAGKITVSESTKEIIEAYAPDAYEFAEKEKIEISSLGKKIKMFFARKVRNF